MAKKRVTVRRKGKTFTQMREVANKQPGLGAGWKAHKEWAETTAKKAANAVIKRSGSGSSVGKALKERVQNFIFGTPQQRKAWSDTFRKPVPRLTALASSGTPPEDHARWAKAAVERSNADSYARKQGTAGRGIFEDIERAAIAARRTRAGWSR